MVGKRRDECHARIKKAILELDKLPPVVTDLSDEKSLDACTKWVMRVNRQAKTKGILHFYDVYIPGKYLHTSETLAYWGTVVALTTDKAKSVAYNAFSLKGLSQVRFTEIRAKLTSEPKRMLSAMDEYTPKGGL